MEDEVLMQELNHLIHTIVDAGKTINPLITEALENSDPNNDTI